jgi:hypothetical protein
MKPEPDLSLTKSGPAHLYERQTKSRNKTYREAIIFMYVRQLLKTWKPVKYCRKIVK